MFTGIIETVGRISARRDVSGTAVFTLEAAAYGNALADGDSVCVDGACLTVVTSVGDQFTVEAVEETLAKTSLGQRQVGDDVNLERALKVGDRLGGHFVLGHVDGTAPVTSIVEREGSRMYTFALPASLAPFCIPVGSIAIDGISFTIARLEDPQVTVSVIPYTYRHTTLRRRQVGDLVNIEVDMLGKYVHRLLTSRNDDPGITMERLRTAGFGA